MDDLRISQIYLGAPQAFSLSSRQQKSRPRTCILQSLSWIRFAFLFRRWQVHYLRYPILTALTHHIQHSQYTRKHWLYLPNIDLSPSETAQILFHTWHCVVLTSPTVCCNLVSSLPKRKNALRPPAFLQDSSNSSHGSCVDWKLKEGTNFFAQFCVDEEKTIPP